MAWETPKTDWQSADPVTKDDMNRIEGNTDFLKNTTTDVHGIEAPYYIAKTSRSDQWPDWADIQNKPSAFRTIFEQEVTNGDVIDLTNISCGYDDVFVLYATTKDFEYSTVTPKNVLLYPNGNVYTDSIVRYGYYINKNSATYFRISDDDYFVIAEGLEEQYVNFIYPYKKLIFTLKILFTSDGGPYVEFKGQFGTFADDWTSFGTINVGTYSRGTTIRLLKYVG